MVKFILYEQDFLKKCIKIFHFYKNCLHASFTLKKKVFQSSLFFAAYLFIYLKKAHTITIKESNLNKSHKYYVRLKIHDNENRHNFTTMKNKLEIECDEIKWIKGRFQEHSKSVFRK